MYSSITPTQAVVGTAPVDLVQGYLDVLLRDVSAELAAEELPAAQPEAKPAPVAFIPATAVLPVIVDDSDELVAESDAQPILSLQLDAQTKRVMPAWAQQGFAGLLFDVAGLKMAAPLHALGGISLIEDRLQPVAGQADWFMGLLRWNGRNLRVVDTARFVMPERIKDNTHHAAYQSVIVLGDSHWALAVDCANESVNLNADEIRWKQWMGTRPWLAGTVLQRLCALLDVDNLVIMLEQHEQHVRKHQETQSIN